MRISDWSSDVCSSDLPCTPRLNQPRGCRRSRSICRIPQQGIDFGIVLPGRPAEIGINAPRPELRRFEGQRDIEFARRLAATEPPRAAFDAARPDAIIGLHLAVLARVGADFDGDADRDRRKLADKALFVRSADKTDCGHDISPAKPGAIPGAPAAKGWRQARARTRRAEAAAKGGAASAFCTRSAREEAACGRGKRRCGAVARTGAPFISPDLHRLAPCVPGWRWTATTCSPDHAMGRA